MDPEESVRDIKGKRSPQWAFMSRLLIAKPDTGLYLDRLRIINTPRFGVYLHHIVQPDPDPVPHDHPWNFRTLVLKGGYIEEFHALVNVYPPGGPINWSSTNIWRRFSWHRMGIEQAHRITHLLGDTWTLVFVGRRQRTWGFYVNGTWLSWDEYEEVAA